jgi:hypothetical protein
MVDQQLCGAIGKSIAGIAVLACYISCTSGGSKRPSCLQQLLFATYVCCQEARPSYRALAQCISGMSFERAVS